jgi:hypothetical protein
VSALGGSYVIITAPQYEVAIAPLAAWKTRKGWPVVTVTTDSTGISTDSIKSWLQEAYDTWDRPPEYVLLVGDVDDLPSWYFSNNVTDLPYALLDGDDWLPDLILGRFSVSNAYECQVMVAKTVHYEQTPYTDQTDWFTRSVMVAGQYASTTPLHTVRFCGEQLAGIGFDPLDPVTPVDFDGNYIVSPFVPSEEIGIPQNLGPTIIKSSIDLGCSLVVYRGWAYGILGWEPPHYTVNEIPSLNNGAMLPVVMSFVCLNGDFSDPTPCFGEVFTRVGGVTPENFKGAVAFIGNGEHWSHTRFNDAMAISVFERITDPGVSTLGALLNAGKLRFMEYFPGELDDQGDEESVEFYFHIYNILGDPELNYYRANPGAIAADHVTELPEGTNLVEVTAYDAGPPSYLAGARVGLSQAGILLGTGITDEEGSARVVLQSRIGDGPVDLTITHPDRLAYTAQINGTASGVYLGLDGLVLDDALPAPGDGNGDGVINPGETLALLPTMRNFGSASSTATDLVLTLEGPASVITGTVVLDPVAAGSSGTPSAPWILDIEPDAADGALIRGRIAAEHDAASDLSGFEYSVAAPDLAFTASNPDGDGWVDSGQNTDLTLVIENRGSAATGGGNLNLSLTAPEGVALETTSVNHGAIAIGESVAVGPIVLSVASDVAAGGTATINIAAESTEGYQQETALPVAIGDGSVGEPSGPDDYGYFAFDSADYLYPGQRPVYRWREISTAFGGPGTKLPFNNDNYDRDIVVDLPAGFDFQFYGQVFQRLRVSDNGWISFEDADDYYNFYNWPIPSAHGSGAVIAPFWDNLTPEPMEDPDGDPVGLDSDGVYWWHDADRDEVIFEWSRMRHIYPEVTEVQSFQVVLRKPDTYPTPTGDGEILFFYRQVADNDQIRMFATVGIESPDETVGLQLTYDGIRATGVLPLGPGTAIRLTTDAPHRVPLAVSSLQRRDLDGVVHLSWALDDDRPVNGWRVYTVREGRRHELGDAPLPAGARSCDVVARVDDDIFLEAILPHGTSSKAGEARAHETVVALVLGEPRPNPMRGESTIAFALPRAGHVRLRVFDLRGRCVRTLVDGQATSGQSFVAWEGRDDRGRSLADGVYFYRLEHAGKTLTRKLLLVR